MESKNWLHDGFNNTCRTCTTYITLNACPMLSCKAITSTEDRFCMFKNIMSACSIQISESDNLPNNICEECQNKFDSTLSFLEKCKYSETILKQQFSIKEEIIGGAEVISENIESYADKNSSEDVSAEDTLFVKVDLDMDNDGFLTDSDDVPLSYLACPVKKETDNNAEESIKRIKKYQCDECKKSFKSLMFFVNHKVKHTGKLPHICQVCGESFSSFQQIKKHMEVKHEGYTYKPYMCQICKETFQSRYHLTKHEQAKHNGRSYSCGDCKKIFATLSSLKYHQNIHLGVRPFVCNICSRSFTQASLLKEHTQNVHCQNKKFVCHCGRMFNRNTKLLIHIDAVHEKGNIFRKYACSECDKRFHHPYTLKNHMNSHLGIKPYLCSVCAAAFSTQNNLHSHFKRKHANEKRVPEKIYLCSDCGDSFARSSHLKRHVLRKHTMDAEKRFECPICMKKFLEKSDVTGHIKLHDNHKPFQCDECSKSFRDKWRRQHHINRVHLGLRPYACTTCDMKFKTKSHLEKHIRTHTGEKPFPCPHCSYMCAEKSNLKKHINIHFKSR